MLCAGAVCSDERRSPARQEPLLPLHLPFPFGGQCTGRQGTDFVRNTLPFPFAGCSHGGLRTPPVLTDRPALPFLLGPRCVESRAERVCL